MQWVIGIDEAGRGPLAGPVAVGAVALPVSQNEWNFWEGLKDSKKLSEKRREEWFARISADDVRHAVSMSSALVIDQVGIVSAARQAAQRAIETLQVAPCDALVLLDWGLSVSDEWQQEQHVKGDERIPAIALASIVAKVSRDHLMLEVAKEFPQYAFDAHKGYGTKAHYDAITAHGVSPLHRRTFLKNIAVTS